MTDHEYEIKYVVVQRVRVRTHEDDPEAGNVEMRRIMADTHDQLRNTFIQGVGNLRVGEPTVVSHEHTTVHGTGGRI